jgi:uncharacterized membrane protein
MYIYLCLCIHIYEYMLSIIFNYFLVGIIDREIFRSHCTNNNNNDNNVKIDNYNNNKNHSNNSNNNNISKINQLNVYNNSKNNNKNKNEIDNLIYSNNLRRLSTQVRASVNSEILTCMSKYHDGIILKLSIIFPKLVAFVTYGNKAHSKYIMEVFMYGCMFIYIYVYVCVCASYNLYTYI